MQYGCIFLCIFFRMRFYHFCFLAFFLKMKTQNHQTNKNISKHTWLTVDRFVGFDDDTWSGWAWWTGGTLKTWFSIFTRVSGTSWHTLLSVISVLTWFTSGTLFTTWSRESNSVFTGCTFFTFWSFLCFIIDLSRRVRDRSYTCVRRFV